MTNRRIYKQIFTISFLALPAIGFSQGDSADILLKVIGGIGIAVIVGAFVSIMNMTTMLFDIQLERAGVKKVRSSRSLWEKWKNRLIDIAPLEKESDFLLDHDYDGIQELDNNLPPWWLYGFYLSIIFSIIYIGYYHYYDYGFDSIEEYEYEMQQAEVEVNNYLETQANTMDESNLTLLTDEESLTLGSAIFTNNCIACHLKSGAGSSISVGPNLTDEYWLHGGSIKDVFKTVKYGVPEKGMISWKEQLKPADMHRVSSYILSLQGTNPPDGKEPQGEKYVPKKAENDSN